jgi:hypothetical protein
MDNGKIEEVNTQEPQDSDPDYKPIRGKTILKLFWSDKNKGWGLSFDSEQFPNMEFILAGLTDRARYFETQIRLANEMRFQQQIAQQMQAAQLAQHIRRGG